MGIPAIPRDSEAAKALATTLLINVEDLVKRNKNGGEIDISALDTHDLHGKVFRIGGGPDCSVLFVVANNGNGTVGENDLFLDGHNEKCKENGKPAFGFAKLFASLEQMSCSTKNIKVPDADKRVLEKLQRLKGRPWEEVLKLKSICSGK